jgi:hypothetical protein
MSAHSAVAFPVSTPLIKYFLNLKMYQTSEQQTKKVLWRDGRWEVEDMREESSHPMTLTLIVQPSPCSSSNPSRLFPSSTSPSNLLRRRPHC